jgi:hypothetical protein
MRPSDEHGWVLVDPPFSRWRELGARAEATVASIVLGGVELGSLRREARHELGLAGPVVVSGHQPGFMHPGIWAKRLLLGRARELGMAALYLVVDTDQAGEVVALVPRRSPELVAVRHRLVVGPAGFPYEALAAPAASTWREFVAGMVLDLETVGRPELLARLTSLDKAAEEARPNARDLGEFLAGLASGFDPPSLPEVRVSRLARTRSFIRFALGLILDGERFWHAHNAVLNRVRTERRLRSPAQPVPDLRIEQAGIELPLWALVEGQRRPVFVRREGSRVVLASNREELCQLPVDDLDQAEARIREGALALRPRAMLLTAFVRLCVADLFVHGTGGREYEVVADRIFTELFGRPPPPFAVVSATVHLFDGSRPAAASERARLEGRNRELSYHPEHFLDARDPAAMELIAEKRRLVEKLGLAARHERPAFGRRLREINRLLSARLGHLKEACQVELSTIEAREREEQAARCREYPWFLYDQAELRRIVLAGAHAD